MSGRDPLDVLEEALRAKSRKVTRSGDSLTACCPAHDDNKPSLTASRGATRDAVVTCHAGCQADDVMVALGLHWTDLGEPAAPAAASRRIVATYDYVDEAGNLVSQKVRYEPKGFIQRRPDGTGGWIYKLGDSRRVLYNLPDVVEAVKAGEPVYIVEGEKDADALRAAGYVATCNQGGAGKWHEIPDAAAILTGADVIVVPDQDAAGLAHARTVVASLYGKASAITVVDVGPGDKRDISDHLGEGRSVDELEIVAGTKPGDPPLGDWLNQPPDAEAPAEAGGGDIDPVDVSWQPVDLADVLAGTLAQPFPTIGQRDDQQALLYQGMVNGMHGDSGVGKGWVTCFIVVEQIRKGHDVLLLDCEDVPASIVARLRLLGAIDQDIAEHLIYVRPQTEFSDSAIDAVLRLIDGRDVTLAVVDSLGEAFGLDGIDENHDAEVGPWLRRVARRIAEAGPAVLLIDHATKAADNPLHPSGSKRKRAAIGGASYLVTATAPLKAGSGGRLKLTCAKDRHGSYARGEHVADLVLKPTPTGGIRADLYAASPAPKEKPIDTAAKAAARAVADAGRPMSFRTLEASMDVTVSAATKRAGIELAVELGLLDEQPGKRGARMFSIPAAAPGAAVSAA